MKDFEENFEEKKEFQGFDLNVTFFDVVDIVTSSDPNEDNGSDEEEELT